jgi:hypothetical protein
LIEGQEAMAKQTEMHTKIETNHVKCNQEILFKHNMKKKYKKLLHTLSFSCTKSKTPKS